ncbi:phosphomevalonate kinase [Condylostylus longicornis]|uniref:phosphomevalonate kinase n=1 Tax=Condylostylus longicornis TaxID=2530218 RepID=UPI00244DE7EE|nr:phosphomevalonate kinase [Condylostylus longicornis]XP_055372204.1 phosphomevalonate kinase [Condylostylus longicornis]
MEKIQFIILFSGKRKTGKDYISENLHKKLGSIESQIIRISEPIKSAWAEKLNLNLKELLSDGPYKEIYRKDMIKWSDEIRSKDYGFFCREAISKANREIIIVSDIRRKTDIKFFQETFPNKTKTIRISCSNNERVNRGWIFEDGVDNVQSECDLDDYTNWDLEILNENQDINEIIDIILKSFNII